MQEEIARQLKAVGGDPPGRARSRRAARGRARGPAWAERPGAGRHEEPGRGHRAPRRGRPRVAEPGDPRGASPGGGPRRVPPIEDRRPAGGQPRAAAGRLPSVRGLPRRGPDARSRRQRRGDTGHHRAPEGARRRRPPDRRGAPRDAGEGPFQERDRPALPHVQRHGRPPAGARGRARRAGSARSKARCARRRPCTASALEISRFRDVDRMLQSVADTARELLRGDAVALCLFTPDREAPRRPGPKRTSRSFRKARRATPGRRSRSPSSCRSTRAPISRPPCAWETTTSARSTSARAIAREFTAGEAVLLAGLAAQAAICHREGAAAGRGPEPGRPRGTRAPRP